MYPGILPYFNCMLHTLEADFNHSSNILNYIYTWGLKDKGKHSILFSVLDNCHLEKPMICYQNVLQQLAINIGQEVQYTSKYIQIIIYQPGR